GVRQPAESRYRGRASVRNEQLDMNLWPEAIVTIANIPAVYGYLVQPPIAWATLATQWAAESGTSIDGRFHESRGEVQRSPTIKRQDTFVHGSVNAGSRTGRAFTIVSGTWTDDLYYSSYGVYGISLASGAGTGTPSELVAYSTTTQIEDATIIVRRGFSLPEALGSSAYHQRGSCFTYIHLAYQSPDNIDYRIALEYDQPIRLDVTYDGGVTWQLGVAIARKLGNVQRYLQANGGEVRFHFQLPIDHNSIDIEIGDGYFLHHAPDANQINPSKSNTDPSQPPPSFMPSTGNIRVYTQNGSVAFFYMPFRYQPITVTHSTRDAGEQMLNAGNAYLTGNQLTPFNAAQ